jgi:hypothetical protein
LAAWLAWCFVISGTSHAFAMPSRVEAGRQAIAAEVATSTIKFAQAQPAPAPQNAPASAPADTSAADDEPIGNVATLTGSATVTRNNAATPLKLKDDIFLNDVLQTSANSTLGVTFNDATTFNLTANARITVDSFVYEDGGKKNGALFNVVKGTVAFVAAAVAKSGDMTISTPTATLGIRGTTGLVEVPEGATAGGANNVAIKLYPDPDGKVGRIEINDRAGARLGLLTQGASGFTIRPTVGGGRFALVPLLISPQQAQRDQGFVRQVPCRAEFRTPDRQPAANPARAKSGQKPRQPGATARPKAKRPAGTEPAGTATTRSAGPTGLATGFAAAPRSTATAGIAAAGPAAARTAAAARCAGIAAAGPNQDRATGPAAGPCATAEARAATAIA